MKAVIFDIGGVIVNDHKLRESAKQELGVTDHEAFWRAFNEAALPACRGEESLADSWRRLGKTLGFSVSDELAQRLWVSDYAEKIEIDEEVLNIVEKLRSQCKVGVISNTVDEHAQVLRCLGVYEKFDDVVLSHEVGMTKDSEQIFDLTLKRLNVAASEAVFIDDVERFRIIAEQKGMQAILYISADKLRKDLLEKGLRV